MKWVAPTAKDAGMATLDKRRWEVADELRANSGLKAGQTARARARVRDAIEAEFDEWLPRANTPELFKAKAGAVLQHVYDKHGRAAYATGRQTGEPWCQGGSQ